MITSTEARTQLAEVLLDKIREDTHPSYSQMMIFEEIAPREMADEYLEVLISKVANDHRPSIPMLRHIAQVASQLR
jgi:hypothetical protein